MKKRIGNVELDYTFYSEKDTYSDGDIENVLLELVKTEDDVENIISHDNRWPILYHLSPMRQNILEWYDFKDNAECLEIGAGCGAITGVLSRKVSHVDCVDLSERRCLINAYRNSKCSNVTIYVANFNNIKMEKRYDYITLIGVLEYAAYYTNTNNPFVDFLKNIKKLLKPGGKVLIAIENKYGLKYWNGRTEDHTGTYFEGIAGYGKTDSKVRTFSKNKLMDLISEAGYKNMHFFYPVPDYKFPKQIFSDQYLPTVGDIVFEHNVYDNNAIDLFDENRVMKEIIMDGMFDFFANSFFVEVEV